jgi:dTMP kinase
MRLSLMLNHYQEADLVMDTKGYFVVVEGLDGSGKTTQARLLVSSLKKFCPALYSAEPSRGAIGRFIRNRILYGDARPATSVEALLFAADRLEHVEKAVKPALARGILVVSDRYLYSSLAYQGSSGLSLEWIQLINSFAVKPDLGVFIDVEPETVLKRLRRKKSVMENLETQQKVREIYLKFVEAGALVRIDGEKVKKEVASSVMSLVLDRLKIKA